VLGITLKDLLTLLITKYFADRTSGTWKTIFEGATVIGVYKVFYPGFIEPLIKGFRGEDRDHDYDYDYDFDFDFALRSRFSSRKSIYRLKLK